MCERGGWACLPTRIRVKRVCLVRTCAGQRSTLRVFLYCSPRYFLRQGLSLSLKLDLPARQAGQQATGINLSVSPKLGLQTSTTIPSFFKPSGGPNSGLQTCTASIYPRDHLSMVFLLCVYGGRGYMFIYAPECTGQRTVSDVISWLPTTVSHVCMYVYMYAYI